ncbi:CBO0543 family protein [Paenibacillus aurantiacus]|uniref:CBO0543 family protein n=1 Tax=Paenibacillus aurantiacus TaxID=1936118 RepID=A0ABV5KZN0_9BACL
MAMTYLLISIAVFAWVVWRMPRKVETLALYGTLLTIVIIEVLISIFQDFRFDRYGYFSHGIDYAGLLVSTGIYPLAATLYLNFFPYGKSLARKAGYVASSIICCMLYERGAVYTGMLYYNGWSWWISMILYPFTLTFLAWMYTWMRRRIEIDHGF